MNQRSIQFETIHVGRVLGIGYGEGFTLTDLSPCVNLIHGPNGSGKTTTARVIQELLWPGCNGIQRPTVSGRYRESGTAWEVKIEAGHAEVTASDQSANVPPVGPKEDRHRYRVALHELIVDDNASFASAVANLTQGGYDLELAERELGYTERPSMPRGLANELKRCQDAVDTARGQQRDIEAETRKLDQLRKERDEAATAEREIELLKKAEDYQNKKEECRLHSLQLEQMPSEVGLLRGDEREKLDELARKQQTLERELETQRNRIDSSQRKLNELKLPYEGVGRDLIAQTRTAQRKLGGVEAEIRQKTDKLAELEETARTARRRLAKHASNEQLALLGAVEIGELTQFARAADRLRAEQNAFDLQHPWLARDKGGDDQQSNSPETGEQRDEVAFPQAASEVFTSPLFALASLIVAVSLILGFLQHWTWFLVILFGPALIAWEWYRRLKGLNEQIQKLNQAEGKLHVLRRGVTDRLGLFIEITDEWLPLLIDNIAKWQLCSSDAAGARRALEQLHQEQHSLLRQINTALQPFGYKAVDSAETAAQFIDDLEERRSEHRDAVKAQGEAQKRIDDTINPQVDDIAKQRKAIRDRLKIDESNETKVDDWLAMRPTYLDLKSKLSKAKVIQDDRCQALAQREDLLQLQLKEIQQRIEQLQMRAAQRDPLTKQIATIETNRDNAMAGHVLTDALEARDAAEAALADSREKCGRAVVGSLLSRWVRTKAIEKSRPDVFARANELLVKFTRGSLELLLDDYAKPPMFYARRGSAPQCPLGELSIGERVQLLMAVRVAFLEHDEATRLPLLMDEALGTTDDYRAGVIIDTVIDIARTGRQIFYFTAQHDEVGKWRARLSQSGLPSKAIDLAEVRHLSSKSISPLHIAAVDVPKPPSPNGMSHDEYGQVLRVANINPFVEHLDNVHIWHFIENDGLLHQLLSHQINTWGQLRTLLKHGGAGLFGADRKEFDRAKIVALLIETACKNWRIGRGRPVDRGALIESGSVSDRFINDLTKLAKDVEGDAQAILEGLERREVSGWLTKNTERLRDFFYEKGYSSILSPLKRADIRIRMIAAVSDDLREGRIEESLIDRIIGQLPVKET